MTNPKLTEEFFKNKDKTIEETFKGVSVRYDYDFISEIANFYANKNNTYAHDLVDNVKKDLFKLAFKRVKDKKEKACIFINEIKISDIEERIAKEITIRTLKNA